jgi:hypothetical protein
MTTTTPNEATELTDASIICAGLEGLIKHINACEEYKHLRGDMWNVEKAIALLSAQANDAKVQEDAITDTDRVNYIESNFHYLGFTCTDEAWIIYHEEKDRRRVNTLREAIDVQITLRKMLKLAAIQGIQTGSAE